MIVSPIVGIGRVLRVSSLAIAVGAVVVPAAAQAAAGSSSCPGREAVARAAQELLAGSQAGWQGLADILSVRDDGDRYVVGVRGQSREYLDETHDCGARAHAAAVFVALTLSPSTLPTSPSPPPPARPPDETPAAGDLAGDLQARTRVSPPAAAPSPSTSASSSIVPGWGPEVEIGAMASLAPRSDGSQKVGGLDLHLVAMAERWGLVLGGSIATSSTLRPMATRITETRFPLDLGVRRSWALGWLRASADLGALVAICQLQQAGNASAAGVTRLEIGARVAVTLATGGTRLAAFLRLSSELIPATREIAIEPRGIIGRTSPVWAGAVLGLAARFH